MLGKIFELAPKDEFKTCEYCTFFKGTHCLKHVRRNRVYERCQHYSYDKNRGPSG